MQIFIRDAQRRSIGYICQRGDFVIGYRMNGRSVGFYRPHLDITYTPDGRRVGYGNLLSMLIFEAQ